MRSTLASLKSRPVLLVFLGLLFLELWGDFKGCSPMLSSFHTALGATLFNGRIWALAGILACAILVAIWPHYFRKKRVLLVKLSTVLALLLTGGLLWGSWYGSFAPEGAAFAAVCSGIIYALLVISILASISDSEISFFGIAVAICAVLTVKTLLLFLLCALPGFLQAAMLLVLPCLSGGSLLTACATKAPSDIELADPKESLPLPFLGLLLFAPMLNAVIRAFSSLGTWGVDTAFGLAMLPVGLGCVLLFILAVAVVFRQREQSDYVDCFIAAIGLLLIGFFLANGGILQSLYLPAMVSVAFVDGLELFSGFTFWLSLVTMGRLMGEEGLRYIAVGQMTRNAIAIPLGVLLVYSPSVSHVVFPVTAVVLAVLLLVILSTTLKQERAIAANPSSDAAAGYETDLAAACERIAAARHLTSREAEVMLLLAQGRSQSFIAKKLVVAESTIKSHSRHVYQKCGVSNKQELISLLHDSRLSQ